MVVLCPGVGSLLSCTVLPVVPPAVSALAICATSQLGQRTAMPAYCAGMRARYWHEPQTKRIFSASPGLVASGAVVGLAAAVGGAAGLDGSAVCEPLASLPGRRCSCLQAGQLTGLPAWTTG